MSESLHFKLYTYTKPTKFSLLQEARRLHKHNVGYLSICFLSLIKKYYKYEKEIKQQQSLLNFFVKFLGRSYDKFSK